METEIKKYWEDLGRELAEESQKLGYCLCDYCAKANFKEELKIYEEEKGETPYYYSWNVYFLRGWNSVNIKK